MAAGLNVCSASQCTGAFSDRILERRLRVRRNHRIAARRPRKRPDHPWRQSLRIHHARANQRTANTRPTALIVARSFHFLQLPTE